MQQSISWAGAGACVPLPVDRIVDSTESVVENALGSWNRIRPRRNASSQPQPSSHVLTDAMRERYLRELGWQARATLRAAIDTAARISDLRDRSPVLVPEGHVPFLEEIFRSVHSTLTHASCISKLLWPILPSTRRGGESKAEWHARRSFMEARGAFLREAARVDSKSVFRERAVRNHLEHFDERIDERILSGGTQWILDNIGPLGSTRYDRKNLFRWLDQYTGEFVVAGDSICLRDIMVEAQAILSALPHPFRG